MRRREFITLLGGGVFSPFGALAQQPTVRVVGFLSSNTPATGGHLASAFVARMREFGWLDGQNLRVEYRWGGGQTAKFRELAAELVAAGADVIVTSGNVPAIAARQTTDTIPIVLASSGDIISTGLVKSLARPGGNVTGLTFAPEDTVGKRCELLKEVVPGLSHVAVLFNPDANPQQVVALRQVASALDVVLNVFEFRNVADLDRIATFSERSTIGALFVVSDPLVFTHMTALNTFAIREKLPTIHSLREYVDAGGLMSYGPDFRDFFRHSAVFVDKILRGAKPEDLPVERPTIFRLVVNLRTARAIGLMVSPMLLARADEVIE